MKNKNLKLLILIILVLVIVVTIFIIKLDDSNCGLNMIELDADYVSEFSESRALIEKNGRSGYIDTNGNEIIPCIYDDAYDFKNGIAVVKQNGKWGCIDIQGNEIVPCLYDDMNLLRSDMN